MVTQIMRLAPSALKGHRHRTRREYTEIVLAAGGWFCLTGFVVATFAPSLDGLVQLDLTSQFIPTVAGGLVALVAGLYTAVSQTTD